MTAYLTDSASGPVTFLSATLVPVPGFPAGRLAHVALARNHNGVQGGRRWPPPPADLVPIRPFAGGVVDHRRGPVNIVYAMRVGTTVGRAYLAAGLRVRYRYQGHVYSTMAWMVTVGCVVLHPDTQAQTPPWCDKAINQATKVVQKQADAN